MPSAQDLFVGIAAIIVGSLLALGAILNSAPLMTLAKPRRLAEMLGPTSARWIIAVLGAAIIVLGAAIATGWRIHW